MPDNVVIFDQVWKKFERGERHNSLRDLIPALGRSLFARQPHADQLQGQQFWAIRDVSFAVTPGRALGIIGPNGAGKSTALKLLSKLLRPEKGICSVKGRVGALIEIASGFHGDLTGRENIFLQGAIMGMKRREIATKIDRIIDFAGVSSFIDTPVKRYSSGMNARLGFSVAAHLDPDVLLIDEVLGVGDVAFQMKCIDRMKQFKAEGVAIVFVSHNLQAVSMLCDDAVFLKGGEVAAHGSADSVLSKYVRAVTETRIASGDLCRIKDVRLTDANGEAATTVSPGQPLDLTATFVTTQDFSDVTFGFYIYRSTDQLMVYDGNIHGREVGVDRLTAGKELTVNFTFRPHLTRGHYHVGLHLFHNATARDLTRLEPAAILSVDEARSNAGVADIGLRAVVLSESVGAGDLRVQ